MANTSKRGFASMNLEKQRTIASKGGRAAHAKGTAHEWSPEEARAAGRKGGESRGTRSHTQDGGNAGMMASLGGHQNGIGSGLQGGGMINPYASNFLAEAGSLLRGPALNNRNGAEHGTYDPNANQAATRANNSLGVNAQQ